MKFEYYVEIVPGTGEKRVLRFADSGKPMPVPFRRRDGEPGWLREARRITFHAALEGAKYINANGQLVAATYTQDEIKGRTEEQARASEAFEEKRRLKNNNNQFITEGTIGLDERDFAAEFQPQPAAAVVVAAPQPQPQSSVVDVKSNTESLKIQVEHVATATVGAVAAAATAPIAPTASANTTALTSSQQSSAQPLTIQLNLLQIQSSASGLASTVVPAVVPVSASPATNDSTVVSKHSH